MHLSYGAGVFDILIDRTRRRLSRRLRPQRQVA